jgi:Mor family transcriptional regulator
MAKRRSRTGKLVQDLILSCTTCEVPSEIAQKAIRAVCRYYGGQMIYIPSKKADGSSAENLRGVIADAVGDSYAEKILEKIMNLYGYMLVYIPQEERAFKKTIALEIYQRYGNDGNNMNDLAREYHISTNHAFRLWRMGQSEKLRPSMPYLPFLELTEYNDSD